MNNTIDTEGMNKTERPYIVAGPCSVESRGQLEAVTAALAAMPQVRLIRCGVWKPRTHPGGFEGMGVDALRWMEAVRQTHPTARYCCEVARPEHVEQALRHGIDALWIGARTTANPFLVQELTEALRGTSVTLLVKNAPSPDVELWIGALERCMQTGLTDLMAVHRGFDLMHNSGYRNSPLWEVPIELRRRMPDVPLLCDPSHIGGRRDLLQPLAQTAMDLGFDGLMAEVHPDPDNALTDAPQQITPEGLKQLLCGLIVPRADQPSDDRRLELLRGQIDRIDEQLMQLCSARFEVVRSIAEIKRQGNMAIFQPQRWDTLLRRHMEAAADMGLSPDFVKELFEKIHTESIRIQRAANDTGGKQPSAQ